MCIFLQFFKTIKQLVGDRFERDCNSLRSITSDTSNNEILDQINEILEILKFEHVDGKYINNYNMG